MTVVTVLERVATGLSIDRRYHVPPQRGITESRPGGWASLGSRRSGRTRALEPNIMSEVPTRILTRAVAGILRSASSLVDHLRRAIQPRTTEAIRHSARPSQTGDQFDTALQHFLNDGGEGIAHRALHISAPSQSAYSRVDQAVREIFDGDTAMLVALSESVVTDLDEALSNRWIIRRSVDGSSYADPRKRELVINDDSSAESTRALAEEARHAVQCIRCEFGDNLIVPHPIEAPPFELESRMAYARRMAANYKEIEGDANFSVGVARLEILHRTKGQVDIGIARDIEMHSKMIAYLQNPTPAAREEIKAEMGELYFAGFTMHGYFKDSDAALEAMFHEKFASW